MYMYICMCLTEEIIDYIHVGSNAGSSTYLHDDALFVQSVVQYYCTYPCPIFSILVYFFVGSPTLTMAPVNTRAQTMRDRAGQEGEDQIQIQTMRQETGGRPDCHQLEHQSTCIYMSIQVMRQEREGEGEQTDIS